jgi:hypothetical protein
MPWGLILCIVIAIGIGIWVSCAEFYGFDIGTALLVTPLCILASVLIWLLIGAITLAAASPISKTPLENEAIEIYALADGNLTEGRGSFLGSSHIDEELKYTFVKKDAFGYTVEQVDADACYVKYTNDTPRAVPIEERYGGWVKFWTGDNIAKSGYIFYLPEGSIIEQYNIDLK